QTPYSTIGAQSLTSRTLSSARYSRSCTRLERNARLKTKGRGHASALLNTAFSSHQFAHFCSTPVRGPVKIKRFNKSATSGAVGCRLARIRDPRGNPALQPTFRGREHLFKGESICLKE